MKNIEVFILTRNRVELLKQSVQSILNQTYKAKVTIVDNNSDDETEKYISELMVKYNNVNYYKQNEFVEFKQNLRTAQKMAIADYVMFFHDDDILHPQYLEVAHKLVNMYDNIDLVCGLLTEFNKKSDIVFTNFKTIPYVNFKTKKDFVTHVFCGFHVDGTSIMFPHVIYKTKNIKCIEFDSNKYGKIADKPFVLDSILNGSCIQIREKEMLFYRFHESQDSATSVNGPFPQEIINHNIVFKDIMKTNFLNKIKFEIFSELWLNVLYKWGGNESSKKAIKAFFKKAYKDGAIYKYTMDLQCSVFRFLLKPIQKKMLKYFSKKISNIKTNTLLLEGK